MRAVFETLLSIRAAGGCRAAKMSQPPALTSFFIRQSRRLTKLTRNCLVRPASWH